MIDLSSGTRSDGGAREPHSQDNTPQCSCDTRSCSNGVGFIVDVRDDGQRPLIRLLTRGLDLVLWQREIVLAFITQLEREGERDANETRKVTRRA